RYAAQPQMLLPGRGKTFIYNDDTEQKMLAVALQVINAKWSGSIEPPKDIAMRLLMTDVEANGGQSSGPHGNGLPGTNRPSDQAIHQAQRILGGNAPVDLEAE